MTSSKSSELNTALLIDGENISSTWAGRIITASAKLGGLLVKRAYGNATIIKGWDEAPGIKLVHTGTGKNSADIALAIEAVDLSHAGRIQSFVLVSSDGDFAHLATFLRERGHHVLGIGEDKAPVGFRKSCSHWVSIDATGEMPSKPITSKPQQVKQVSKCVTTFRNGALYSEIIPHKERFSSSEQQPQNSFDKQVLEIVKKHPKGITKSEINKIVRAGGGKISDQEQKTWASYFKARKERFSIKGEGQQALVTTR